MNAAEWANIPAQLTELRGWVVYKLVHKPNKPKPDKVPYYVTGGKRHGTQGEPPDRAKLATFDDACARLARGGFDGVGLAMLPDWGVTALDFDNCITGGVVHPVVLQLVTGTYAEISPSGSGVRAFMQGSLSPDRKFPPTLEWPFQFETFHNKGFVTVTGRVLGVA